jgi:hypothetical protein
MAELGGKRAVRFRMAARDPTQGAWPALTHLCRSERPLEGGARAPASTHWISVWLCGPSCRGEVKCWPGVLVSSPQGSPSS